MEKKADKMIDLIEKAGLTESVENLRDLTLFLPSEKAISEIPTEIREELVKDKDKLQEILLHHITTKDQGKLILIHFFAFNNILLRNMHFEG